VPALATMKRGAKRTIGTTAGPRPMFPWQELPICSNNLNRYRQRRAPAPRGPRSCPRSRRVRLCRRKPRGEGPRRRGAGRADHILDGGRGSLQPVHGHQPGTVDHDCGPCDSSGDADPHRGGHCEVGVGGANADLGHNPGGRTGDDDNRNRDIDLGSRGGSEPAAGRSQRSAPRGGDRRQLRRGRRPAHADPGRPADPLLVLLAVLTAVCPGSLGPRAVRSRSPSGPHGHRSRGREPLRRCPGLRGRPRDHVPDALGPRR